MQILLLICSRDLVENRKKESQKRIEESLLENSLSLFSSTNKFVLGDSRQHLPSLSFLPSPCEQERKKVSSINLYSLNLAPKKKKERSLPGERSFSIIRKSGKSKTEVQCPRFFSFSLSLYTSASVFLVSLYPAYFCSSHPSLFIHVFSSFLPSPVLSSS